MAIERIKILRVVLELPAVPNANSDYFFTKIGKMGSAV
jgi:hypothetical protein